jgi:hypothetical protein
MRRVLAVLALGAVLVACSERATSPQPQTPAIAADFMNNPDNGNPRISRSNWDIAVGWGDPTNGLRAAHWTYQVAEGCGDTPDGGFLDGQAVVTFDQISSFATRAIANAKGRVWIRVRDLNTPGDCFGTRLVATGWGTLHYHDNNLLAEDPNNQIHENAYGFTAEGTLTTPEGGRVKYSGHSNCQWKPADVNTWTCTEQVNLH